MKLLELCKTTSKRLWIEVKDWIPYKLKLVSYIILIEVYLRKIILRYLKL